MKNLSKVLLRLNFQFNLTQQIIDQDQQPHLSKMEPPPDIEDSSLAHPDEQWKIHRTKYEHKALINPIQNLGHGLHPRIERGPLYDEFDDADKAQEINDCDVYVWIPHPGKGISLVRWKNMQRSMSIAIFSPTCGIFARIPVWCVYLQVVNIVEEITTTMRWVIDKLVDFGADPTFPLFECHIYEPIFENMPEEFVKCATQVKTEIVRLVRPALTHFMNYKFKIKPFKGMLIDNDENGPAIEAQWIPEADRMVLAICRELKPDGSYGKIENLDWVDDVVIEDVTNVPPPDWVVKLERTESAFADHSTMWLRPAITGEH